VETSCKVRQPAEMRNEDEVHRRKEDNMQLMLANLTKEREREDGAEVETE
jgi:hypothetical protein